MAVVLHFSLSAQTSITGINELAGHFVKNIQDDNKEKIIFQTDRKVYATGEKVWFKAFLVKALNDKLDTASKNLYVDLVNDEDRVMTKLVLNALDLRTGGAISLSDSLAGGYYWIRCYTKKMLMEDTGSVYIQPIYLINPKTPDVAENSHRARVSNALAIDFYPEGGNLITGLNSAAAVKITDANDNPVIATGTIVNNHDSVVASFTTNKFGLARVTFYPLWFQKYVMVVHANGQDIKYPLPPFNRFAAQLSVVNQSADAITAHVALEDSIYSKSYTTYILGISRDSVCFASVGRGMYQVNIPAQNFPGGIASLLLFDEQQHLLSEREVFINRDNYSIKINPDKPNYGPRENARLNFEVTDANGRPEVAALNIAVQDAQIAKMSDAIETDTLVPVTLSFEDWLKRDANKMSPADIDLLMLGHNPQYKNWLEAKTKIKSNDNSDVTALLYLHGQILNKKSEPQPNQIVTVLSENKSVTFFDVDTTKADGRFELNMPLNKDSLLLKIQVTDMARNPQLQNKIVMDTFSYPHFTTPAVLKNKFSASNVRTYQKLKKFYTDSSFAEMTRSGLAPVFVSTLIGKPLDYDSSKRVSKFTRIYTSADLANYGSNLSNMVYSIPGMVIKNGFVTFLSQTSISTVSANDEPIIVMDGVQTQIGGGDNLSMASPVMQYLSTLNAKDIDFIEIISGPEGAAYGVRGANGVIVINTRTKTANNSVDFGIKIVKPFTYHFAPKFSMPDYSNKAIRNAKTPDPRATIYWNGDAITDPSGKGFVNFYTADAPSNYVVTVTGITANGDYINKQIVISRK